MYTESDSKIGKWQEGALSLSQAQPAPTPLGLKTRAMEAGLKLSGCPTQPEPIFESRAVYTLSICIPTYNFGKFIGETLDSILSQWVEGIEVVILDSGSTDETPQVVQSYASKYPHLAYHRREKKGGIDRDVALLASLARGRYLWFFSSDDVMKPGAIAALLEELRSSHDLYLCGFTVCGFHLDEQYWEHPIFKTRGSTSFDLSVPSERTLFFEEAVTTTAFFSFIGNIAISKKRWDETACPEQFYGSCWGHAARIFGMLEKGLKVRHIDQSLLLKRGFNDSFLDRGIVHRFAITIDGYHAMANTFFGPTSPEAFHIRRVVQYELPLKAILISAKSQVETKEEEKRLDLLVEKLYQDRSLLNTLRKWLYFRLSPSILRPLKFIYDRRSFFKHLRLLKIKELFSGKKKDFIPLSKS